MSVQPAFGWSVANGGGVIDAAAGVYTAPNAPGSAAVQAASASVVGTAAVSVVSPPIGASELTAPVMEFAGGSTGTGARNVNFTVKNSVVGHMYQIESTEDLVRGPWRSVGPPQSGGGGNLLFSIPADSAVPSRFYRIRVQ